MSVAVKGASRFESADATHCRGLGQRAQRYVPSPLEWEFALQDPDCWLLVRCEPQRGLL